MVAHRCYLLLAGVAKGHSWSPWPLVHVTVRWQGSSTSLAVPSPGGVFTCRWGVWRCEWSSRGAFVKAPWEAGAVPSWVVRPSEIVICQLLYCLLELLRVIWEFNFTFLSLAFLVLKVSLEVNLLSGGEGPCQERGVVWCGFWKVMRKTPPWRDGHHMWSLHVLILRGLFPLLAALSKHVSLQLQALGSLWILCWFSFFPFSLFLPSFELFRSRHLNKYQLADLYHQI